MIGAILIEVGAATFTLYPGAEMPAGLAKLIDGHEPRRHPAQARAFRAAQRLRDLTPGAFDENVADTVSTRRPHGRHKPGGFTTMSTTATPEKTGATARRKPAKAKRPTAEQLKAMTPDERAVLAPDGLAGKALEHFIATGETSAEQMKNAIAQRKAAAKAAKSEAASKRAKAAGTRPPVQPRDGITAMEAAERVLRKATGPMKVSEIAEKAVKLAAFKPTSKTPEASVAARVHVSAKQSDGVFIRVARGVVDLRELNPKAKTARPAAS